jgi:hypothetical protein
MKQAWIEFSTVQHLRINQASCLSGRGSIVDSATFPPNKQGTTPDYDGPIAAPVPGLRSKALKPSLFIVRVLAPGVDAYAESFANNQKLRHCSCSFRRSQAPSQESLDQQRQVSTFPSYSAETTTYVLQREVELSDESLSMPGGLQSRVAEF